MATSPTTTTTIAEVKSPFASKTNITGAALALFGLLGLLGVLPEGFDAPSSVEAIVTGGGILVMLFRTFTKAVLRK